MKLIILSFCLLAFNASAQTIVQACKDARGAIYYENAPTLKKHCTRVEDESLSVIPSDAPRKKLPVSVGMSQDQVRNNWDKPAKITRFETRAGATEQWEYGSSTLTFANGVLEVIQH
jgi:hypothetical protein